MTIEKSDALVLSVMPFRESSVIATLFTKEHGRVSGIAKGIRKSAKEGLSLERGLRVELFLHVKPHRDLQVIGQNQVIDYFPSIRADLNKLSIRDAAFEIALKSVTSSGPHPELFGLLLEFLKTLNAVESSPVPLSLLAHFLYAWAFDCGFGLATEECARCGKLCASGGGSLSVDQGTLVCTACYPVKPRASNYLSSASLLFLKTPYSGASARDFETSAKGEIFSLVNLLADHCRFHFDIRQELKTMSFLRDLLFLYSGSC